MSAQIRYAFPVKKTLGVLFATMLAISLSGCALLIPRMPAPTRTTTITAPAPATTSQTTSTTTKTNSGADPLEKVFAATKPYSAFGATFNLPDAFGEPTNVQRKTDDLIVNWKYLGDLSQVNLGFYARTGDTWENVVADVTKSSGLTPMPNGTPVVPGADQTLFLSNASTGKGYALIARRGTTIAVLATFCSSHEACADTGVVKMYASFRMN